MPLNSAINTVVPPHIPACWAAGRLSFRVPQRQANEQRLAMLSPYGNSANTIRVGKKRFHAASAAIVQS
jgi:hypothetical protein